VFNRLNTGGINLKPQEIRTSMYHSPFYELLYQINARTDWRRLLSVTAPDLHMKDVEILLRGFAMLLDGDNYAPSMLRFLNQFSRKCRSHSSAQNDFLRELFNSFLEACSGLPPDAFLNKRSRRFNLALYEAAFAAVARAALRERRPLHGSMGAAELAMLESDSEFLGATFEGTTQRR